MCSSCICSCSVIIGLLFPQIVTFLQKFHSEVVEVLPVNSDAASILESDNELPFVTK